MAAIPYDLAAEPWAVPLSAVTDTGVVLGTGPMGTVSVFLWHRTRVVARAIGKVQGPRARHSALVKEVCAACRRRSSAIGVVYFVLRACARVRWYAHTNLFCPRTRVCCCLCEYGVCRLIAGWGRQVRTLAATRHPALVGFFGVVYDDKLPDHSPLYLLHELMDTHLEELLGRGSPSTGEIFAMGAHLARGIKVCAPGCGAAAVRGTN